MLMKSWMKDGRERRQEMYTTVLDQRKEIVDITSLPVAVELQPEGEIDRLLKELSPDSAWGDRQIAAQKLGSLGDPSALPGLLAALPNDPFWMVRTAMIQAVERIGDPTAIAALREVEKSDGFQVVRSYAAKAIERLAS
jgi:HEAT repeat protein